jgi:ribosomal protein S3AE
MAQLKRRKKLFDVEMPLINKETQLVGYNISELDGKTIKYDLTRVLRGKSLMLKLRVKVEGDKITTSPKELKILPYFLRRMIRKGTNYVEDSFSTVCEDAQIRIKPFLVTRRKVSRAVRKALRNKTKEEIIEYVKTRNTMRLFDDVLKNKLQKELSLKLKKIYPLSLCEIRILQIEKEFEAKHEKKQEKIEEKPKKKEIKEDKKEEKEEEKKTTPKKEKVKKEAKEKEEEKEEKLE